MYYEEWEEFELDKDVLSTLSKLIFNKTIGPASMKALKDLENQYDFKKVQNYLKNEFYKNTKNSSFDSHKIHVLYRVLCLPEGTQKIIHVFDTEDKDKEIFVLKDYIQNNLEKNGFNQKEIELSLELVDFLLKKIESYLMYLGKYKPNSLDKKFYRYFNQNQHYFERTIQLEEKIKEKTDLIPEIYDFIQEMNNKINIASFSIEEFRNMIREASKNAFISYKEGHGRFANINVVESLLPKGYESELFDFHLKDKVGNSYSIKDIEKMYDKNISIIGEGGIGKTTFFQFLLEREFNLELSENPIPIFIELNQCTKDIMTSQNKSRKTNFIIRYITKLVIRYFPEYTLLEEVLLERIEEDLNRTPINEIPSYRLLLDGFNEVSLESKELNIPIRVLLSNEIEALSALPNVRILTNSRPTRSANYTRHFSSFFLTGLEDQVVKEYIDQHRNLEFPTEYIYSNDRLMRSLRIPLYLLLFCQIPYDENYLPESQGEILYLFFHRNGNYYNLQKRILEVKNGPFYNVKYSLAFFLDFLLPYIGSYMETNDTFYINEQDLNVILKNCFSFFDSISNLSIPFVNFEYSYNNLCVASQELKIILDRDNQFVISCLCDYLGLLYNSNSLIGNSNNNRVYGFIHHYFRDYFSSIWEIKVMKLLPYLKDVNSSLCDTLGRTFWSNEKAIMIGQILQEYRNAPVLNRKSKNWGLPQVSDNRALLIDTFKYFGKLPFEKRNNHTKRMIKNLFLSLKLGRKDLSGINFDYLDLSDCNLFGINFSKQGKSKRLAASFNHATISNIGLDTEEHLDQIEEYVYTSKHCITIDQEKCVKGWNLISDTLDFQIKVPYEAENPSFVDRNYLKVSSDESLLAIKIDSMESDSAFIYVYELEKTQPSFVKCVPEVSCSRVLGYSFRKDENILYAIFGNENNVAYLYLFDLTHFPSIKTKFITEVDKFYNYSFYCQKNSHDFYILGTFNNLEEELKPCFLMKYNSEQNIIHDVFDFSSTSLFPPIAYVESIDTFFYYDKYDDYGIYKLYDIVNDSEKDLCIKDFDNMEVSPLAIYQVPESTSVYNVIFDTDCFLMNIEDIDSYKILEHLEIGAKEDESAELYFYSPSIPSNKRYLLYDFDQNKYEWNIELEKANRKYNTKYYETVACLYDEKKEHCILVHRENGISVFYKKNDKVCLMNAFNYKDDAYLATSANYSSESGILAILFEDNENRCVKVYDMQTTDSKIVFAKQLPLDDNIEICLNKNGDFLMIIHSEHCFEYDINKDTLSVVYNASKNEKLLYSYYEYNSLETIHVGIGMRNEQDMPKFDSRCEIYHRDNTDPVVKYILQSGYYLPSLTIEESTYFIHQNHDLGISCKIKKDGMETFRVTSGFFMEDNEFTKRARTVQAFDQNRNNTELIEIGLYSFIMAEMTFAIDRVEVPNGTFNVYSYLDYAFKRAIFIYDYQLIKIWDDLKGHPESYIVYNYKEEPEYTGKGSLVWDFAIPMGDSQCICCYNSYMLCVVDMHTGKVDYEIEYDPGVSICGCKFKNIISSEDVKLRIMNNGAILE